MHRKCNTILIYSKMQKHQDNKNVQCITKAIRGQSDIWEGIWMSELMFPLQVKISVFVEQHLLKTSKVIRQLYAMTTDADSKVREWVLLTVELFIHLFIYLGVTDMIVSSRCQLQAMLRLELCRLVSSEQSDSLGPDQMAEEVRCSDFLMHGIIYMLCVWMCFHSCYLFLYS